jgi:hypothetical protein
MTEQSPPEVHGISEQAYNQWRNHPVTLVWRKYLLDYRADLLAAAQDQWLEGHLDLSTADEMKGRALLLGEVGELPFSAIYEFYRQIEQAKEQDSDATTPR